MPFINRSSSSMDIPLGLSMAMAQNPTVFSLFEKLDNNEIRELAGIGQQGQADMLGQINGLYSAADSFGRTRMF